MYRNAFFSYCKSIVTIFLKLNIELLQFFLNKTMQGNRIINPRSGASTTADFELLYLHYNAMDRFSIEINCKIRYLMICGYHNFTL